MSRKILALVLAAVALVGILFFVVQPGGDQRQPSAGPGLRSHAELKLRRDGTLAVTETVDVASGTTATRRAPLRIAADQHTDRIFTVSAPTVVGSGSAEADDQTFTVHLGAGRSTITYTVDGAVAGLGDQQELRWQPVSGWDVPVDTFSAVVAEPGQPNSITCLAGAAGSHILCAVAKIDQSQVVRLSHTALRAGDRIDVAVGMAGSGVPVNARLVRAHTLAAAFAPTPLDVAGAVTLAVLLLGGFWLLWHRRVRAARVVPAGAPVPLLVRGEGGHVAFASPDGVLPGQVGAVATERARAVDIAATVLDLAVRNYLWIQEVELPDGRLDWQVVRRNAADPALTGFERAVYASILPDEAERALLSQVANGHAGNLREALFGDVVARGWLARPPRTERLRWLAVGAGIAALGVGVTATLAGTAGHAMLGLPLIATGLGLAVLGRWLPVRTRRGAVLLGHVAELQHFLDAATPEDVPVADRELVFSRSLPYAVALGVTDRWLRAFAGVATDADGVPGLYWFGSCQPIPDLTRFAERFPALLAALAGQDPAGGPGRRTRTPAEVTALRR
ncbi:DUF2207 domain-containing protein [Gandjariella thermophila]|uniref:DUF2207 domain-containing protein n=1 Tax=Gandjariella thermophila TaxID=1931992 RepID=A0A4D4J7S3_9PSEU|nr:DUF2207 domain-containing protein [Gandjariella thermophila]GDY31242.1 hypothetical protein GTS_28750 [Gandjariella thermophila]